MVLEYAQRGWQYIGNNDCTDDRSYDIAHDADDRADNREDNTNNRYCNGSIVIHNGNDSRSIIMIIMMIDYLL